MLWIIIILFGLVAVGGLILATLRWKEVRMPKPLAVVHGVVAILTLVALILIQFIRPFAWPLLLATILFIGAAVVGISMGRMHKRGGIIPISRIVLHAILAVTGFVILFGYQLLTYRT